LLLYVLKITCAVFVRLDLQGEAGIYVTFSMICWLLPFWNWVLPVTPEKCIWNSANKIEFDLAC